MRTIAILSALAIAGCGGGSEPAPLATGESYTQAGDANTGSPTLILPLQGPELALQAPQIACVRVSGQLTVQAHYAALAHVSLRLSKPSATGETTAPLQLMPGKAWKASIDYAAVIELPAGNTPLMAMLSVRSFDTDTQFPTGALGRAEASADWTVEAGPC